MNKLRPDLALPISTHRPDEVDLFLFSASCWLPHRIHYDRDYARLEDHTDLVVQGPLQGAYLIESVVDGVDPRARVVGARYRHVSPSYVGEQLECRSVVQSVAGHETGARVSVACEVWNLDRDAVSTAGVVEIWVPADAAEVGIR